MNARSGCRAKPVVIEVLPGWNFPCLFRFLFNDMYTFYTTTETESSLVTISLHFYLSVSLLAVFLWIFSVVFNLNHASRRSLQSTSNEHTSFKNNSMATHFLNDCATAWRRPVRECVLWGHVLLVFVWERIAGRASQATWRHPIATITGPSTFTYVLGFGGKLPVAIESWKVTTPT